MKSFGTLRSAFPGRGLLYLGSTMALVGSLLLLLYLLFTSSRDVYDASQVFTPCLFVPGDGSEHRAEPGCKGMSRIGGREAPMAFNSMGLRDREYPSKPGKGVFRVLVLGSSNMLGPGVEEKATFPRRLEQSLAKLGKKPEVINAGMVGYCTIQASFRLRELLLRYSPSLVVYQFVQAACPLFDGAWAPWVDFEDGRPRRIDRSPFERSGGLASLNSWMFGHRGAFFLWLTAADQWRKAAFSRAYTAPLERGAQAQAYMAPTLPFLSYMRAAAKEAGAGFVVFSYRMKPFTQSVPAYLNQALARFLSRLVRPITFSHDEIFAVLEREGFAYVYPDIPTKNLLMEGDTHLNEEGLRVLAEAVAKELK